MAEEEDVESLKRRGRRRLIGAIALVVLAVIVLPMVFDPEPKTSAPPVQIRIPGEGESTFNPKGNAQVGAPEAARGPATAAPSGVEPAVPRASPEAGGAEAKIAPQASKDDTPQSAQGAPGPEAPPAAAHARRAQPADKRAEAPSAKGGYIVPVAAFSSSEKVKELASALRSAKLPYFTEPVATAKGPVTRVRAGPFASREAAERARNKLHGLGLKPGNTVARPG